MLIYADWQESFRAESPEVLAPLLGKTNSSSAALSSSNEDKLRANQKKHETKTVKALLSMSAVDTPLLMLAFAAGISTVLNVTVHLYNAPAAACIRPVMPACVQEANFPIAKSLHIIQFFHIKHLLYMMRWTRLWPTMHDDR